MSLTTLRSAYCKQHNLLPAIRKRLDRFFLTVKHESNKSSLENRQKPNKT